MVFSPLQHIMGLGEPPGSELRGHSQVVLWDEVQSWLLRAEPTLSLPRSFHDPSLRSFCVKLHAYKLSYLNHNLFF